MYFPFSKGRKWKIGLGGLPPEKYVELVPFRMPENALLQNRMYLFSSLIFKG